MVAVLLKWRGALALAVVAGFAGVAAVTSDTDNEQHGSAPVWTEAAWPFPPDPFGIGKAYRCGRKHCGAEIQLFVRPKLGFCDCTKGVADDDDLDRMGDLYLVDENTPALQPGHAVMIGTMRGRARAYELSPHHALGRSVISIAANDRCDMIVATAVVAHQNTVAFEPQVIAFLNSASTIRWIERTLGL